VVIDFVRHSSSGQDVECEILTLRSWNIRVTVDPAETGAAGKVGD